MLAEIKLKELKNNFQMEADTLDELQSKYIHGMIDKTAFDNVNAIHAEQLQKCRQDLIDFKNQQRNHAMNTILKYYKKARFNPKKVELEIVATEPFLFLAEIKSSLQLLQLVVTGLSVVFKEL